MKSLDFIKKPDLVFSRKGPFSTDESDCIRIGLNRPPNLSFPQITLLRKSVADENRTPTHFLLEGSFHTVVAQQVEYCYNTYLYSSRC